MAKNLHVDIMTFLEINAILCQIPQPRRHMNLLFRGDSSAKWVYMNLTIFA